MLKAIFASVIACKPKLAPRFQEENASSLLPLKNLSAEGKISVRHL